jgi:hypothetical protein
MNIFNLPQDIFKDKNKQSERIIFHNYSPLPVHLKEKAFCIKMI